VALRKAWVTFAGWLLVVVGIIAMPLPGPGLLILLSGLVVLSQEYEWAERRVEPVKEKAIQGAKQGVATYPRIAFAALSATAVVAVGVWWSYDPRIPTVWLIGPRIPFHLGGWPTGSSIVLSGLIAWGVLIYSIKRYRKEALDERNSERRSSDDDRDASSSPSPR
jgi:uncharacterized protein (TIGR02611 family)